MQQLLFLTIFISILFSCKGKKPKQQISVKEIKEKMIEANKRALYKENLQIDAYVKRKNLKVIKSGRGLRYQIYHKGNGIKAEKGAIAVVNYQVTLLDGTVCYTTKEKGAEQFIIGKDNVESGLHEAIQHLHIGDKAIFIIPSYLAHGMAGDFNKIPSKSTIVYDIELVTLK